MHTNNLQTFNKMQTLHEHKLNLYHHNYTNLFSKAVPGSTGQTFTNYLQNMHQDGLIRKIPNISSQNASILLGLIQEHEVSHILEIGSANGYSSIHFAHYLKQTMASKFSHASLHTIEASYSMAMELLQHLHVLKLHTHTTVYIGNACTILPNLQIKLFDCVFIDAQKSLTHIFCKHALNLLKRPGLLLIDDVLKFSDKMLPTFNFLESQKIAYTILQTDLDDAILYAYLT